MGGNHKRYFKYIDPLLAVFPKFLAKPFYKLFKNKSGNIGFAMRYLCIRKMAKKCGSNLAVYPRCELIHIDKMEFGENISIHTMCYLDAVGGISIGDNVSIAHASSLISFNHTYNDPSTPIKYNPCDCRPIVVDEDVWIGCGCRVLAGVKIGKRSVIAAGAVVNRDVENNSIYAGVPAKKIKSI